MAPLTRRRQARKPYDVVFYAPFVGWMLASEAKSPPGGAETQIFMLSRELVRRGLRVAIIAFGERSKLPGEIDGVHIVSRPPHRLAGTRLVGKVLEAFLIWQALWRAPARTVVYRCASMELALVGMYTKVFRQRLVFSTANVFDFDFGQVTRKRRDLLLYRLGVRLAADIVVQTEEQVRLCERNFGKAAHLVSSLSPVVGPQTAEPEAFLWIGRLVWYKQPLAYVELANAVPEAKFWMIGVPSNEEDEQHLVQEVSDAAQATPNLELLAPRSRVEVGELMQRAVASVNTACFEGMPNVLLEAWSRGVPALVLHHDPDGVVSDRGLGGFADGSTERLAELARALWRTRHHRSDLARRCLTYVGAHHAPDVVAGQWADLVGPSRADAEEPQRFERACVG